MRFYYLALSAMAEVAMVSKQPPCTACILGVTGKCSHSELVQIRDWENLKINNIFNMIPEKEVIWNETYSTGGGCHGFGPSQPDYYHWCFTNSRLNEIERRHKKQHFIYVFITFILRYVHSQQITKLVRQCLQYICYYPFTFFIRSRISEIKK